MLTPSNPRHGHDESVSSGQVHYRGNADLAVGIVLAVLGEGASIVLTRQLDMLLLTSAGILMIGDVRHRATAPPRRRGQGVAPRGGWVR